MGAESKNVGFFNALDNPTLFPAPPEQPAAVEVESARQPTASKAHRRARKQERLNKRNGRRQKR